MLHDSCYYGHVEIVKWLTSHFNLSPEDARADDNYALRWSCANGHLDVAQWITSHFKLSLDDVCAVYKA